MRKGGEKPRMEGQENRTCWVEAPRVEATRPRKMLACDTASVPVAPPVFIQIYKVVACACARACISFVPWQATTCTHPKQNTRHAHTRMADMFHVFFVTCFMLVVITDKPWQMREQGTQVQCHRCRCAYMQRHSLD